MVKTKTTYEGGLHCSMAVSYTHLDVYKRQEVEEQPGKGDSGSSVKKDAEEDRTEDAEERCV